jgi:hypothetical protein
MVDGIGKRLSTNVSVCLLNMFLRFNARKLRYKSIKT